jgi:hypothetical protein
MSDQILDSVPTSTWTPSDPTSMETIVHDPSSWTDPQSVSLWTSGISAAIGAVGAGVCAYFASLVAETQYEMKSAELDQRQKLAAADRDMTKDRLKSQEKQMDMVAEKHEKLLAAQRRLAKAEGNVKVAETQIAADKRLDKESQLFEDRMNYFFPDRDEWDGGSPAYSC